MVQTLRDLACSTASVRWTFIVDLLVNRRPASAGLSFVDLVVDGQRLLDFLLDLIVNRQRPLDLLPAFIRWSCLL